MILNWKHWSAIRIIFLIAGLFTLSSILLGYYIHIGFFILGILVGVMQMIFALTGFCPAFIFLRKVCGLKCDLSEK